MRDELPTGWVSTPLQNIASTIQYGYTASAEERSDGPRFLRITDIQDGHVDWHSVPSCDVSRDDLAKYRLAGGDIVFARSGATTGKSFLVTQCPRDAIFASYLIRVRPTDAARSRLLSLYFQTPDYWEYISGNTSGNAQPNCNGSKLANLPVMLPPLAEQDRIVAKVEGLLSEISSARDRLAKVPGILRRLRQSILVAACSGRLTEEWRAKDLGRNSAYKPVSGDEADPDDDHESPFELPPGWRWVQLGQLGAFINGDRSKNYPSKTHRVSKGIPFINAGHLSGGAVDFREMDYITEDRFDLLRSGKVQEGDILYCLRGSLGKSAIITGTGRGAIASSLVIIRLDRHKCSERYVFQYLSSPLGTEMMRKYDNGSAQPNLSAADLAQYLVPLPPMAEQREIVRRVDALFALSDVVDARVVAASSRADKLTQSIIAKAFRGELVPTEAELAREEGRDYEPASGLLKRIRAGRAEEDRGSRELITGGVGGGPKVGPSDKGRGRVPGSRSRRTY